MVVSSLSCFFKELVIVIWRQIKSLVELVEAGGSCRRCGVLEVATRDFEQALRRVAFEFRVEPCGILLVDYSSGKLSSWLNPFGVSVLSFLIQKSSLFSRLWVISWSVIWVAFSSLSMSVILACFSKSWSLFSKKCLSTAIESGFLASDRWLFVLRFEGGSLFPT